MKKHYRLVSIILVMAMLFTIVPLQVFAAEGEAAPGTDASVEIQQQGATPEAGVQQQSTEAKILGEIIEKREKNVKHFLKDDMTYEAAVYPVAVHYKDGDEWKDIDNTLVENKDEENNDVLENKQNDYKVKIAKNAKANKLVSIKKDKYELSWNIENSNESLSKVADFDTKQLDSLSENDRKKALTKLYSTVDFMNVFTDIDLQYQIRPEEVKEYIIINKQMDNPVFTFNLAAKNLVPTLKENRTIIFYDENDASKEIFIMEAPFMTDANGEMSYDVGVTLDKVDNRYEFTVKPDIDWLNNQERVYPVKIDPYIKTSQDSQYINDSYVRSYYPNSNYNYSTRLWVSDYSTLYRSYISFTLPSLTSADYITNASLFLLLNQSYYNNGFVIVSRVLGQWNANTITWNNQPSYSSKAEDYVNMIQYGPGYMPMNWNITDTVKYWYDGGNNNGLVLLWNPDGTHHTNCSFVSSNASEPSSYRPQITINYVNNSGLENYWTYHSQNAGRAGTGYVNDSNGNLVFVHNDVNMSGNRMPVTINHVYNSNEKGSNIGYGQGWRLNLNQTIIPQIIDGTQYYIYTDDDGTKHYFKYNSQLGKYIDESGLNLTLIINVDNTYTIRDKGDNLLNFNTSGYLNTIVDVNGNTMTLGYNGTTLMTVTDGADRVVTLNYTNGILSSISEPSNRTTGFEYTGSKLTKIVYQDTKYSTYEYDVNYNMTSAINNDGYKLSYTYYTISPYRMQKVLETHTSQTLGQELTINYGINKTTFTDVNNRKNIYQFNDSGNTISIKDSDGDAQYFKYLKGTNISNKLSSQSKLQKMVSNYLKDPGAENNIWIPGSSDGSTGGCYFSTLVKYIGNKSLYVEKTNTSGRHYFYQTLTLTKGNTYTLSGYIKADGISSTNSKGAALFVTYQNSSGIEQTVDSSYIKGTSDWTRCEVKFTLPIDAASDTVYIKTGIVQETGNAYIDCLQLESGSIANRYNLIENPDMSYGTTTPESWSKNSDCDYNDTLVTLTDSDYPPSLDKKCFKFVGVPYKNKKLSQVINISGKEDDVLTIGGWAKGESVYPTNQFYLRYFALEIALKRPDLTEQVIVTQFNMDSQDWQYLSERIIADSDYTSITFRAYYGNNMNTAYFDGLQLYREEFSENYQYDSNGNITSAADLNNNTSQMQYNTTNDLTKYIDPHSKETNLNYDSEHQMLDATSAESVIDSFTYDNYGNMLTSKVGNESQFIKSSSVYIQNGNYINTSTDPSGNTVTYNYNQTKGVLDTFTDAKNKTTSYTYDNLDRLTDVYKTVDGQEIRNIYGYENDRLNTITHNGFNYSFGYDSLGNTTGISAGTQSLVTNVYEARTSKLLDTTYGNGQKTGYDYDGLDRIDAVKYNDAIRYKYEYDSAGNVGYHEDLVNSVNYRYMYDIANRLIKTTDTQGNLTMYGYDKENNMSKVTERVDSKDYITNYIYDDDSRPETIYYIRPLVNNNFMEYFPLNDNTTGTKGTIPIINNPVFDKDENNKPVLSAYSGTNVQYKLGLNKNAGTMTAWFNNKSGNGTKRYIISNETTNSGLLDIYIGTDNILKVGIKNISGVPVDIINTGLTIQNNIWYYSGLTWYISGSTFCINIFVSDPSYPDELLWYLNSTTDYMDFSGATTSIGSDMYGTNVLNGLIENVGCSVNYSSLNYILLTYGVGYGRGTVHNNIYDSIGRLSNTYINNGRYQYNTSYTYIPGIEGSTTNNVQSM